MVVAGAGNCGSGVGPVLIERVENFMPGFSDERLERRRSSRSEVQLVLFDAHGCPARQFRQMAGEPPKSH